MTWLGLLHLILVIVALAVGTVQFLRRPGTRDHRRRGYLFVGALLVSDVIVFGIYEDSQTPGIFHLLAIISLVSLIVATALVRGRTTLGRRMAHAHVMLWSFGGVVAAGLGQGATAIGHAPWPVILATFAVIAGLALRMDFRARLGTG
jgi:uncharacterized membrane protein